MQMVMSGCLYTCVDQGARSRPLSFELFQTNYRADRPHRAAVGRRGLNNSQLGVGLKVKPRPLRARGSACPLSVVGDTFACDCSEADCIIAEHEHPDENSDSIAQKLSVVCPKMRTRKCCQPVRARVLYEAAVLTRKQCSLLPDNQSRNVPVTNLLPFLSSCSRV
jgi:hypothetical protein